LEKWPANNIPPEKTHVGNDDQPVHDGEMGCALRITDRNHKHHFRVKFIDFSIIGSYELCKRIVL
jgi:hypothetical protein